MFTLLNKKIESLSSMNINCEAVLDYATCSATIAGQRYVFPEILNGSLPRIADDLTPFKLLFCLDNAWPVRQGNSGEHYVYNTAGDYIGEADVACAINILGIKDPKIVRVTTADGIEQTVHNVCTVGYSEVLKKYVTWGFGSLQTADTLELAIQNSCLNSSISLATTMQLKAQLMEMLNYTDYLGLHGKTEQENAASHYPIGEHLCDKGNDSGVVDSNKERGINYSHENVRESYTEDTRPETEMESENDTVVEPPFKGSPHYVSGEQRQHNLNKRLRSARVNSPQSGDHKQHNISKMNYNPGAYRPRVEGHTSESAADENVLAYDWYRFGGARTKKYNDHHKSYDLAIEPREIFGVRAYRDSFFLIMSDELSVRFKLSEKEVKLLLKVCKPFKGKIKGIDLKLKNAVTKPIAETKPTVRQSAIQAIKNEPDPQTKVKIEKKGDSERPVLVGNIYLGYFQRSAFTEDFTAVVAQTEKQLIKQITELAIAAKQLTAPIFIVQLVVENSLVQRVLTQPLARFKKAVIESTIQRSGASVRKIYLTKNTAQNTQKVRQPKIGFKHVTPLFSGMGFEALVEIKRAIMQDYFSKEFRPSIVTKDGVTLDTEINMHKSIKIVEGKPPRLLLSCQNTSPQFKQEAKFVIARLQDYYGKRLRSKISELTINDAMYTLITIALAFPKRDDATNKRSRKLYEMHANAEDAASLRNQLGKISETTRDLTRLMGDSSKLSSLEQAQLTQKRMLLDKLQESVDKTVHNCLVLLAPVYAIKSGEKLITVEVVDVDIAEGNIYVREVRGNNKKELVHQLWTYTGRKII